MERSEILAKLRADEKQLTERVNELEEKLKDPNLPTWEFKSLTADWWKAHGALSYNLQFQTYFMSDGTINKSMML